jgi:hypothetical protein
MVSTIIDPSIKGYSFRTAHPESQDKTFEGIIQITPEEQRYLENLGFNFIYGWETKGISSRKVPGKYHVSLGPRSETLEGELSISYPNGGSGFHMSHWHPSCVSKEKLVGRIEGDILDTIRFMDSSVSNGIDVLVEDAAWTEVVNLMRIKYTNTREYLNQK